MGVRPAASMKAKFSCTALIQVEHFETVHSISIFLLNARLGNGTSDHPRFISAFHTTSYDPTAERHPIRIFFVNPKMPVPPRSSLRSSLEVDLQRGPPVLFPNSFVSSPSLRRITLRAGRGIAAEKCCASLATVKALGIPRLPGIERRCISNPTWATPLFRW